MTASARLAERQPGGLGHRHEGAGGWRALRLGVTACGANAGAGRSGKRPAPRRQARCTSHNPTQPARPLQCTQVYASGSGSSADEGEGGEGGAGGSASSEELAALSDADIEALDAASLRRLLLGAGLPASGKISKLRERLREARDAA